MICGDYWHSLPKAKVKDANQDFMLAFHGYKVFRFTGSEIKKSAKKCIDKLELTSGKNWLMPETSRQKILLAIDALKNSLTEESAEEGQG